MIRLTLSDGTRTQIEAADITDVEPVLGGALIHRTSGDPLMVMQDARTIQTRVNAELDTLAHRQPETEAVERIPEAVEIAEDAPIAPDIDPPEEAVSRLQRIKRSMGGRISTLALAIAQVDPTAWR